MREALSLTNIDKCELNLNYKKLMKKHKKLIHLKIFLVSTIFSNKNKR